MDDSSKHALNLGQMVFRERRPLIFRKCLFREQLRFRVKPGMTARIGRTVREAALGAASRTVRHNTIVTPALSRGRE